MTFFATTLGFAFGALVYALYPLGWALAVFSLVVALTFFILSSRRGRMYVLACLFFLLASAGMGRTLIAPTTLPDTFAPLVGTAVLLDAVVAADPDVRETSQRVTLEVEQDGVTTRVLAVAPLYPTVALGDHVKVRGDLVSPKAFDTDGGRVFRYDRFLAKSGIFALIENASLDVVAPRSGLRYQFFGALADVKHLFARGINVALPEPASSLASGILVGGKQGLGAVLLEAFTIAGLIQIVVLSGYNVMIVAEGVLRSLRFLSKRTAFLIAIGAILLFILIAGAGSSAVRAGIMATIALYARATGRSYAALRGLALAIFLMLLVNPLLLAYDPGLGLSIVATAGLILGTPLIEPKLAFIRSAFLRDIVATTLAAQIAVLPLLLYQTGNLSLVSVMANILTAAVIPVAMAASAIAGLAGIIVPAIAPVLGLPAYALLSYVIWIAENAAALPLSAFTLPAFPFALAVAAYAGLIYVVYTTSSIMRASTTPQFTLSRKAST